MMDWDILISINSDNNNIPNCMINNGPVMSISGIIIYMLNIVDDSLKHNILIMDNHSSM